MAKKIIRTIPFRRKQAGKTDYNLRLTLLKSGKPRMVLRPSLKNFMFQITNYVPDGDHIVIEAKSRELKKYGWNATNGNLPAAYLTGFLAGKKCVSKGVKTAVADFGPNISSKGSRLYAAIKGCVDAGMDINCSKEMFPSDDRINGKHIESYAKKLKKEDQTQYSNYFSEYLKNKSDPETLSKMVIDVKKKIDVELK